MKDDEFAFFNQQLAAMVRDGIPLEAALRRLCADMRKGKMRGELEALEADLAKGVPLRDAVRARELPELYRQMLEVAAQSNDLPGILTMLADHYQRRHVIATRLKGLMVYPTIVLIGAFLLSCFLAVLVGRLAGFEFNGKLVLGEFSQRGPALIGIWIAPVVLGLAAISLIAAVTNQRLRRTLRWRVPAFRDAGLVQIASALALMLRSGVPLDGALALVQRLERGSSAETELTRWRQRLAEGHGKFSDMTANGNLFPPLFTWTVSQSQEDLAAGFQRAADIYQSRATYRTELLLYSVMPCSVLALGAVIITQVQPVIASFVSFMSFISE
jgi:type IV pilus assembly protein PilC